MPNIIFTTTAFSNESEWQKVRINLAKQTVLRSLELGFVVVILDYKSKEVDLLPLRKAGAHIFAQSCSGMGNARREALTHAKKFTSNSDDILIWTEPEKHPLVEDMPKAIRLMNLEHSAMGFFNRDSLVSYPPEQACAYEMVRIAAKYLLGKDLDFMFGPLLFRSHISQFWLDYEGDLWDCIHIPKLRAMLAGYKYSVIKTSYVHPREQTEAEIGNMKLFLKRIQQTDLVIKKMICECKRKG